MMPIAASPMLLSAESSAISCVPHHLDLLGVDAALGERLADGGRLRAAGDDDEDRLRIEVLGALHVGRKVRIGDRHAHRADDLAAAGLEAGDEAGLGVMTGP